MYYRWIDTKMLEWAEREIRVRSGRAWESLYAGEREKEAVAKEKAERE
jgi:hypothetical protein